MSVTILTDQNFQPEVLESSTPVLVDFWAPWCGPCRIQGPIVEELSSEVAHVKVAKMNVDENTVSNNYGIMSIPTLIIFKDGKVVEQIVGLQSKDALKKKLEAVH